MRWSRAGIVILVGGNPQVQSSFSRKGERCTVQGIAGSGLQVSLVERFRGSISYAPRGTSLCGRAAHPNLPGGDLLGETTGAETGVPGNVPGGQTRAYASRVMS